MLATSYKRVSSDPRAKSKPARGPPPWISAQWYCWGLKAVGDHWELGRTPSLLADVLERHG